MNQGRTDWSRTDFQTRTLVVAAVLLGIAGLFGLTGLAVVAAAVLGAGRRWYGRVDLPPAELARLKWEQAKAAAGASVGAWHETEQKSYTPRRERVAR